MEHRRGEHIEIDLPVRLNIRCGCAPDGQILNVSLSGAFVGTSEHIPAQANIDVEFMLMHSRSSKLYRVAGYVVRRTENGIALEWQEFAPRAIRALFALLQARVIRQTREKRPAGIEYRKHPTAYELSISFPTRP